MMALPSQELEPPANPGRFKCRETRDFLWNLHLENSWSIRLAVPPLWQAGRRRIGHSSRAGYTLFSEFLRFNKSVVQRLTMAAGPSRGQNWPHFNQTVGITRKALGYPQAQAHGGRLSTDRVDHRRSTTPALVDRAEA